MANFIGFVNLSDYRANSNIKKCKGHCNHMLPMLVLSLLLPFVCRLYPEIVYCLSLHSLSVKCILGKCASCCDHNLPHPKAPQINYCVLCSLN